MQQKLERGEPEHIGDGVYIENDGWHVVLRANSHLSPHSVALEPSVFVRLIKRAGTMYDPGLFAKQLRMIADELEGTTDES